MDRRTSRPSTGGASILRRDAGRRRSRHSLQDGGPLVATTEEQLKNNRNRRWPLERGDVERPSGFLALRGRRRRGERLAQPRSRASIAPSDRFRSRRPPCWPSDHCERSAPSRRPAHPALDARSIAASDRSGPGHGRRTHFGPKSITASDQLAQSDRSGAEDPRPSPRMLAQRHRSIAETGTSCTFRGSVGPEPSISERTRARRGIGGSEPTAGNRSGGEKHDGFRQVRLPD